MSYSYSKIDAVNLAQAEAQSSIGTGEAMNNMTPLPNGGMFDPYGSIKTARSGVMIAHRATINDTTATALQTKFDDLRAKVGSRVRLYRMLDKDSSEQWTYARLLHANSIRRPGDVLSLDVDLMLEMVSPIWYAGTAHADDLTLDASPKQGTIVNAGNATVENGSIRILANGSNITALTIERWVGGSAVEQITFSGTITAGTLLIIDCGAWSVLNNGVNAYASLARGASHTSTPWFKFVSGNNVFKITKTGGDATSKATFVFFDGYE